MNFDSLTIDSDKTGKVILSLMIKHGHTIQTLSELSGLSENTIRNYISGRNLPSMRNLGILANLYNVSIADIIVYIIEEKEE